MTKYFPLSQIYPIGFGGASLSGEGGGYGFGPIEKPIELLDCARELGCNFFDTAPIYGHGQSERTIGPWCRQFREKIFICNKGGIDVHPNGRVNLTNDPFVIQKQLEESLRKMQTDYIDLYMIHWPDPQIDIRFAWDVLLKAQLKGYIHYCGLSNTNVSDYQKVLSLGGLSFLQGECNLQQNSFANLFDDEFFLEDQTHLNIPKIGWGTFNKGILAGSVHAKREFHLQDARSFAPWWKKSKWREKADWVQAWKNPTTLSLKQLAFYYSRQHVDISLVGFKTMTQLTEIFSWDYVNIDDREIMAACESFQQSFLQSFQPSCLK